MTPRVAVIGQSGEIEPQLAALAYRVGQALARGGAVLFSGGRDGVMEAASRGAREAGGVTVGILPDGDPGNPHLTVRVTTGMDVAQRSMVLLHSAEAVIMLGGAAGTLIELAAAYGYGLPIVVLPATGGWAARVPELVRDGGYLDHRRRVEIRYAAEPGEAAELALRLARGEGD